MDRETEKANRAVKVADATQLMTGWLKLGDLTFDPQKRERLVAIAKAAGITPDKLDQLIEAAQQVAKLRAVWAQMSLPPNDVRQRLRGLLQASASLEEALKRFDRELKAMSNLNHYLREESDRLSDQRETFSSTIRSLSRYAQRQLDVFEGPTAANPIQYKTLVALAQIWAEAGLKVRFSGVGEGSKWQQFAAEVISPHAYGSSLYRSVSKEWNARLRNDLGT